MISDLEAAAESPHATYTMPVFPQSDINGGDISEMRVEPGLEKVPHVAVRHRNTNQASAEARESTVSAAEIDQALSKDEAQLAKGTYQPFERLHDAQQ
jgi:hypothetical protein